MRTELADTLREQGAVFYPWSAPEGFDEPVAADEKLYRFVTSFATREEDIERFHALIA